MPTSRLVLVLIVLATHIAPLLGMGNCMRGEYYPTLSRVDSSTGALTQLVPKRLLGKNDRTIYDGQNWTQGSLRCVGSSFGFPGESPSVAPYLDYTTNDYEWWWKKVLQMLKNDLNANCVRFWEWRYINEEDHRRFLNEAYKLGIHVIVPFSTHTYKDVVSVATRNRIKEDFRRFLNHLLPHPAVLAVFIGNEPDAEDYTDTMEEYFSLVGDLARIRDEVDEKSAEFRRDPALCPTLNCRTLLSVPLTRGGFAANLQRLYTSVDIDFLTVQPYDDVAAITQLIDDFETFAQTQTRVKPLFFGENGRSAQQAVASSQGVLTLVNSEAEQATYTAAIATLVKSRAPLMMGVAFFNIIDENWKASSSKLPLPGCPNFNSRRHVGCGSFLTAGSNITLIEPTFGLWRVTDMRYGWPSDYFDFAFSFRFMTLKARPVVPVLARVWKGIPATAPAPVISDLQLTWWSLDRMPVLPLFVAVVLLLGWLLLEPAIKCCGHSSTPPVKPPPTEESVIVVDDGTEADDALKSRTAKARKALCGRDASHLRARCPAALDRIASRMLSRASAGKTASSRLALRPRDALQVQQVVHMMVAQLGDQLLEEMSFERVDVATAKAPSATRNDVNNNDNDRNNNDDDDGELKHARLRDRQLMQARLCEAQASAADAGEAQGSAAEACEAQGSAADGGEAQGSAADDPPKGNDVEITQHPLDDGLVKLIARGIESAFRETMAPYYGAKCPHRWLLTKDASFQRDQKLQPVDKLELMVLHALVVSEAVGTMKHAPSWCWLQFDRVRESRRRGSKTATSLAFRRVCDDAQECLRYMRESRRTFDDFERDALALLRANDNKKDVSGDNAGEGDSTLPVTPAPSRSFPCRGGWSPILVAFSPFLRFTLITTGFSVSLTPPNDGRVTCTSEVWFGTALADAVLCTVTFLAELVLVVGTPHCFYQVFVGSQLLFHFVMLLLIVVFQDKALSSDENSNYGRWDWTIGHIYFAVCLVFVFLKELRRWFMPGGAGENRLMSYDPVTARSINRLRALFGSVMMITLLGFFVGLVVHFSEGGNTETDLTDAAWRTFLPLWVPFLCYLVAAAVLEIVMRVVLKKECF